MSRPHIEFIPTQFIPWQRGLYGGSRPEVDARVLSLDADTGASSVILRYPPGWARPEPEHLDVDEEFFVLDGEIEINDQRYSLHCYGHFPARHLRQAARSPRGAVVITFFSGEPKAIAGAPTRAMNHPERLVPFVDSLRMPGHKGTPKELFPNMAQSPGSTAVLHKRLKTDPVTGEITWVVAVRGGRIMTQTEIHPVVEEEFCISGDTIGPHGNMRPGAYFWRPAGIKHGPFASHTGFLHLIRAVGGPYTTIAGDASGPFNWDAPYAPILPPPYQEFVRGYRDIDTNY